MDVLGEIEKHFWLTRSMARTVGVSLGDAMASGLLRPDAYSRMVTRCRTSNCAERCAQWLGQQSECHASEPPPFCAHVAELAALRPN